MQQQQQHVQPSTHQSFGGFQTAHTSSAPIANSSSYLPHDIFSTPVAPAPTSGYGGYAPAANMAPSAQPVYSSNFHSTPHQPIIQQSSVSYGGFQQPVQTQISAAQNQDFGDFESAKPVVATKKAAASDAWGNLVNLSDIKPKSEETQGVKSKQGTDFSTSFSGLDGFSKSQSSVS